MTVHAEDSAAITNAAGPAPHGQAGSHTGGRDQVKR